MDISQKSANGERYGFLMSNSEANQLVTVHLVTSGVKANEAAFHTSLEGFVLAGLDRIADKAAVQAGEAGLMKLERLSGDPELEPLDPQEHAFVKALVVPLDNDRLRTVDALALVSGERSRSDVLRTAAWAAVHDALNNPDMDEKWEKFEGSRHEAVANLKARLAAAAKATPQDWA